MKVTPNHPQIACGQTIEQRLPGIFRQKEGGLIFSDLIGHLKKIEGRGVGSLAEYCNPKAKYVPVRNRPLIITLSYFE